MECKVYIVPQEGFKRKNYKDGSFSYYPDFVKTSDAAIIELAEKYGKIITLKEFQDKCLNGFNSPEIYNELDDFVRIILV